MFGPPRSKKACAMCSSHTCVCENVQYIRERVHGYERSSFVADSTVHKHIDLKRIWRMCQRANCTWHLVTLKSKSISVDNFLKEFANSIPGSPSFSSYPALSFRPHTMFASINLYLMCVIYNLCLYCDEKENKEFDLIWFDFEKRLQRLKQEWQESPAWTRQTDGKNLVWFGELERKLAKLSKTTFTYSSSS